MLHYRDQHGRIRGGTTKGRLPDSRALRFSSDTWTPPWERATLGSFFNLGNLANGQSVDVTLADGVVTHWVTTSNVLYPDGNFPDSVVYNLSGPRPYGWSLAVVSSTPRPVTTSRLSWSRPSSSVTPEDGEEPGSGSSVTVPAPAD